MNTQKIAELLRQMADEFELGKSEYRTIHIPKGLTIEQAYTECVKLFPCWRWTNDDLDALVTSDRTSNQAYSVQVRNRVEADEELKNLSANQLQKQGIKGITLLERLVLELDYFKETGQYLDVINTTLCSGSRSSDGDVPRVGWRDGGLGVSWCGPDRSDGSLRAREVDS